MIEYFNRPPRNRLISKHGGGEEKKKGMAGYGIDIEMNRIRRILHRLKLSKGKKERKEKKNLIASNKQSIYILKREISRGISFKIGSFWIRYQVQYAFVRQTPIKLHRSHQFTEGMSMGLLDSISSNVIRYRGRNVVSTR